jgi:hypothetical protein
MSIGTSSLRTIGIKLLKKHIFNGKEETAIKPRRMTPHLWKLEYNKVGMYHRFYIFICIELCLWVIFQGIDGMKNYPIQFSRFPYYEHLQIAHLFDTMHIRKNVTETLWRILDGRSDKEKIVKICSDIQEANHAMKNLIDSNNNGHQNSLPWLFTEQGKQCCKRGHSEN